MSDVNDYITGKILVDTKLALRYLKFVKIPIIGSLIGKKLLDKTKKFVPRLIDLKMASESIQGSMKCAVRQRVCRAIHKDSEHTESVFLDELAEGMIKAEKAQNVTKEEALNTLKKHLNNPLILSKVSGEYMEICPSSPGECVYWNMGHCRLKCINRTR